MSHKKFLRFTKEAREFYNSVSTVVLIHLCIIFRVLFQEAVLAWKNSGYLFGTSQRSQDGERIYRRLPNILFGA